MYKLFCRIYQFVIKIAFYFVHFKDPVIVDELNAVKKIPLLIKENGLNHPLIVTDKVLLQIGALDSLIKSLDHNKISYSIFDGVVPNPTTANVEDGFNLYRNNNCDCLIGFGGGSPIDTAKVIGAKAIKPNKPISKFMGLLKVGKKLPILFAVPTTSGTGSEATIAAVIIDEATNHKLTMTDPHLMPSYAILDPLLTKSLPPFMTATTGMDALCHAVESYTNNTYCTKYEKELAKKAVKLVYENILDAYNNGENLITRHNMQLAAYYAGRSFTRGSVGYVHAIGHTFSALYKMGHGHTMSIILPVVLRKYGKSVEKRLAQLAKYIGFSGNNNHELADNFITWIEETNKKMNIGNKIELLQKEDFPQIIAWATKEANPIYPCPQVWKYKDFEDVLNILLNEKK